MKFMTSSEIRKMWLDFFESKGHHVEPGSSLIPKNDPTLLWINAGVAALKKYFDGREVPPCKRITNAQKCIRTNDIDNVGHTARHHTFFEMMGNFSIGDYFRNEIIPWAVELLTSDKWYGMPKEKLYITYFPDDISTKECWIKSGISADHLIPQKENFWEIGEGPCGPDTEIFFDRGEKFDPNHIGLDLLRNDIENDRYIEIWNIVFSQYNSESGKKRSEYKELPNKNIDTGSGLERLTCIIQDTDSNFETDLFWPLIEEVSNLTNKKYSDNILAFRVISDHIRSITFALADGEMFSNEGRGYVLRRLLRRAERYGRVLGLDKPFLFTLVPIVANMMKSYYPYVTNKVEQLSKIIKQEEEKFLVTLTKGEALLDEIIANNGIVSGEDMFKLYDTFGFPKELTMEICDEHKVKYDLETFDRLMLEQKERARSSRGDLQSMFKQSIDLMNCKLESEFSYDDYKITAKVIALFKDGVKVDSIVDEGDIMFDKTCFYAESGGQVSDDGTISNAELSCKVTSVIKAPNKQHLHHVIVNYGTLKVGDSCVLEINKNKRNSIKKNHSSVHLLQQALNEVLGDGISQKGSYVTDEYAHFDFNYSSKISKEQLFEIEKKVNEWIASGIPQETKILPIEEANKIGAKALFDDKYGDVVRVVCFGDVSKEFCGGTHVSNTNEIGLFIINFEESVSSGVRRIQSSTSITAYNELKKKDLLIKDLKEKFNVGRDSEIINKVNGLIEINTTLNKQINQLNSQLSASKAKDIASEFTKVNGLNILFKYIKDSNRDTLLSMIDSFKNSIKDTLICLVGNSEGSIPIVCYCSETAVKSGKNAGLIVRAVASVLEGSGGGRPELASGAGKNIVKINEAEEKFKEFIC